MDRPDEESFADLLRRAQEGDRAAKEMLFDRLGRESSEGGTILAMARKILPHGDRARRFVDSWDLTQSTLRTAWADICRFRGTSQGELFRWLRTILLRKVSRAVRRKRPEPGLENHADGASPCVDALIREEMLGRLRASIQRLPEQYQRIIDLRLQGLTSAEIGRRLGVSDVAVRKSESRALARLRKELA